ncbi:MAG: ARMT1-like domain-containing protein [Bacteroidales bacterium]|nr:ARMT1-like domain-containing protein [Bacteroidales bacterium]
MKPELECIPCYLQQALKISSVLDLDDTAKKEIMAESLDLVSPNNELNKTTPYYIREIWKIIKKHTDNKDPYKSTKQHYNQMMQERAIVLEEVIQTESNPFRSALKIAIAANVIDFGSKQNTDEIAIVREIDYKHSKPLYIDHHKELKNQIKNSKTLLYLGDNCGEIVFDKLFIQQIQKLNPDLAITFAVRGAPIINDVTVEDAEQVNMHEVARVIDNGSDAPGTEVHEASETFRKEFYSADVIISKGQGNFESLSHIDRGNIFFLFRVKCDAVSKQTQASDGSHVCFQKT